MVGTTDVNGKLSLKNVKVDKPIDLTLKKEGYKQTFLRIEECCSEENCSPPPQKLARLNGKLRLSTNVPSGKAIVRDPQNKTLAEKTADSEGDFEFSSLPTDRPLTVTLNKPGFREKAIIIDLSEGDSDQPRNVQLDPQYASIVLKTDPARVKAYMGTRYLGETGDDHLLIVNEMPLETVHQIRFQKTGYRERVVSLTIPHSYDGKAYKPDEIRLEKMPGSSKPGEMGASPPPSSIPTAPPFFPSRPPPPPQKTLDPMGSLQRLAESGDAAAQSQLGNAYFQGSGVPKDYKEASRWFLKSAEQGNAVAQFFLGLMYQDGRGLLKDYREAAKWYRRSAEQGNAPAQCNLGLMYQNGQGFPRDYREALKWLRLSAERGGAAAQNNLGVMYEHGWGVAKDYAEAAKWYFKAAEQGLAQAQFNLGLAYKYGRGVARDYNEAKNWFRRAAEQGHERAKRELR
ncbi:MAG: hypothetical protein WBG50_11320 [Desulfomonilaceae bacterium]